MAALAEQHPVEVVDLRSISPFELEDLLTGETEYWREHLHWDFSSSADLVRRYVETRSLSGFALAERWRGGRNLIGYAYYVCEEHKALIGNLYVAEHAGTKDNEYLLLDAVLNELRETPAVHRVECQLMMLRHGPDEETIPPGFPGGRLLQAFGRNFMAAEARSLEGIRMPESAAAWDIVPWNEGWMEESARLIAACYQGHIDSQINDQYRTPGGARRFLANIVQYPGCGRFFPPGSLMAIDRKTRTLCGISLASLVEHEVGHITQICVAPWAQGRGLGYRLMQRSLGALLEAGCGEVSLTVTASNTTAVRLYERLGFRVVRRFAANVWEWS